MKLTVIIPAYNAHKTIRAALDSIPHYPDIDIIIADDASDEGYDYLLKEYTNLTIVRNEVNGGAGVARNAGMKAAAANTDWITFIDADDEFVFDIYSLVLGLQKDNDLIISSVYYQNKDTILSQYDETLVHGIFFRKSFLDKYNLHFHPKIRIMEDVYFVRLVKMFTDKILYIEEPTYLLKYNSASTTQKLQANCGEGEFWYFKYIDYQLEACLASMMEREDYSIAAHNTEIFQMAEDYNGNKDLVELIKQVDDFSYQIVPKYKLSIIIPLYNSHKYIKDTLTTLYKQMERYAGEFEVICTDDNSDNYDYEYLRVFPNLRILYNNKRKRMGGNRNRAIRAAQGEWICFLDHEDRKMQEGIDFFMSKDWSHYNAIEFSMCNETNGQKSNFDLVNYCVHGCIYRTNFMRKYNLLFLENMQTSEDVYLHRHANFIIQHESLQDTFYCNANIPFGVWVWLDESTYHQKYNNREYDEEFLYTSIIATVEACRDMQGILDEDVLIQYLKYDYDSHLWQMNWWKNNSKNYKKSNLKIMLAIYCYIELKDKKFLHNYNGCWMEEHKLLDSYAKQLSASQKKHLITEILFTWGKNT